MKRACVIACVVVMISVGCNDETVAPGRDTGGAVDSGAGDATVSDSKTGDTSVDSKTADKGKADTGAPDKGADTQPPDLGPDSCVKTTCTKQGTNCGTIFDKCGGTLKCGSCTYPATCAGGGKANVCGCANKWQTTAVDTVGSVGQWTSLAVDSAGALHVAYYDPTAKDLKYASRPLGQSWSTGKVDTTGDVGQYASLALGSKGSVHVAYTDLTNKALKHASMASGSKKWTTEIVHKPPFTTAAHGQSLGAAPSLYVDAKGGLHVSYDYWSKGTKYGRGSHDVVYISRAAGATAWGKPQLADTNAGNNGLGSSTSLVMDSAGGALITYGRHSCNTYCTAASQTGSLVLVKKPAAGTWTNAVADTSATVVGGYSSMVRDATGALHVSHYDVTNGDLRYSSLASGSKVWSNSKVDSAGDVGQFTSLAVDSVGTLYVAYYDKTNTALKFATKKIGGAWSLATVDAKNSVGQYASIALERSKANKVIGVHITYYDATSQDLRHAYLPSCP